MCAICEARRSQWEERRCLSLREAREGEEEEDEVEVEEDDNVGKAIGSSGTRGAE